jgi:K+-sensing histidine kinase KdpD
MEIRAATTRIKNNFGSLSFDLLPRMRSYIEEKTLLPLTWFVRVGFLVLVVLRLYLPSIYLAPSPRLHWWAAIVAYLVYLLVLGCYAWRNTLAFASLRSKESQIVADICFAGLFFFLNGDHESNLVLAALLPLLIAARYFDLSTVLKVFMLVLGVMLVAMLGINLVDDIPVLSTTPRVFLVKSLVFVCFVGPLARSEFLKSQMKANKRDYRRRLGLLVAQVELAQREDIASLVQEATEVARKELQAEAVSLFLYQDGRFRRQKCAGIEDSWFSEEGYAPGEGITGQVGIGQDGAGYGTAICDNQVEQSPHVLHSSLARYRAKLRSGKTAHLVAVPVNGSNRTFGILRAVNKLSLSGEIDPEGFTAGDSDMLASIGALVAFAYSSARRDQKMRAILEVSETLPRLFDQQQICQKIAEAIVGLGYPVCCVLLRESNDSLRIRALCGLSTTDGASLQSSKDLQHEQIDLFSGTPKAVVLQTERWPAIAAWAGEHNLNSVLRLPLFQEDQVVGVLEIYSTSEHLFYPDEIRTLEVFAAQATMAIVNARLSEQNQDQFHQLEELAHIISSMIAFDDLNGLFEYVAHCAAALLHAEDCSILWVNRDQNTIDLKAAHSIPSHLFVRKVTPISAAPGSGLPAYVAATGQPLCFIGEAYKEHMAWDGRFRDHLTYLPSKRCSSLLLYPIRDPRGRIVGVIKAENKYGLAQHEGFTPADQELLDLLTTQISIAVDKIGRIRKLRLLHESAQMITEVREQREVLERIVKSACQVLDADLAVILPYDSERAELLVDEAASYGQSTDAVLTAKPRESGPTRDALQSSSGFIVVEDLEHEPSKANDFTQQEGVRAFVAVALKVRKKPVGILYCDFRRPRHFTPEEIRNAQAFGELAAIAISNAQLFARLNHTVQELSAVQQLTKAALKKVDLDVVLESVVGVICDTLGFELCTISLVNEVEHVIETRAARGIPDEWKRMSRHNLDSQDIQAWIVQHSQTAVIHGWDERFDREIYDRFHHERLVRVFTPIYGRAGIIGIVEAGYDRSTKPIITAQEVATLDRCLEQVALVIESARLLEQARRHAEQLEILYGMSQQMDRILSLSQEGTVDVLQLAANTAAMVAGPETSAAIHIYDRQSDTLILRAWQGADRELLAGHVLFAAGQHHKVVTSSESLILPGAYQPGDGVPAACIPLRSEHETLGTLCVLYNRDHWFSPNELKILELCAAQVAIAISIIRATQQIQQLDGLSNQIGQIYRSEVEQTLAIGGDTLANLLEVNQRLSRQLDGLSDEIGRFYHLGIGQPLAIASDTLENLLDERQILGPLTPVQASRLRNAMQELTTLKYQIKRLLMIRKVEEKRISLAKTPIELRTLIQDALGRIQGKLAEKNIKLICFTEHLTSILELDKDRISEALGDILINATKFTAHDGKIVVLCEELEKTVRISVCDNGRGIAPEYREKVFDKYIQEPPLLSNQYSGAGLGLYLARKFVRLHGGEITVESELEEGSTFTITLPR